MIKYADNSNFKELISSDVVVVDFYADWCGPCKMLGPVLDELANERNNVSFVKVDVDKFNEIANEYDVVSIPTLILFSNGDVKVRHTGFMPKELLNNWIEEHSK